MNKSVVCGSTIDQIIMINAQRVDSIMLFHALFGPYLHLSEIGFAVDMHSIENLNNKQHETDKKYLQ